MRAEVLTWKQSADLQQFSDFKCNTNHFISVYSITRDPDQDNLSSLIYFDHFFSRLRVTKGILFVYNL